MLQFILLLVFAVFLLFLVAYVEAKAYEEYVEQCKSNHQTPMSYERWSWERGQKND